jgi:hypothetical protein
MQKVEGSNPFSRLPSKSLHRAIGDLQGISGRSSSNSRREGGGEELERTACTGTLT